MIWRHAKAVRREEADLGLSTTGLRLWKSDGWLSGMSGRGRESEGGGLEGHRAEMGATWCTHHSLVSSFQESSLNDLRFPASILFYFQNSLWGDSKETWYLGQG